MGDNLGTGAKSGLADCTHSMLSDNPEAPTEHEMMVARFNSDGTGRHSSRKPGLKAERNVEERRG